MLTVLLAALALSPAAGANTSHAGWPALTGMLLMNKADQSRPLDGRVGQDPFDGSDPAYSCDGVHRNSACDRSDPSLVFRPGVLVPAGIGHNWLLGGHGNNTIHAGPRGDVLWGDYKPSGDPPTQINHIYGGPGADIIYAAHGTNYIWTGSGADTVHVHFGHGEVHCGSAAARVYASKRSVRRYHFFGCRQIYS
ncbi:MAG: hypothetical protein NVSMB51_09370 [Solirubrobacteraceae bacterium]